MNSEPIPVLVPHTYRHDPTWDALAASGRRWIPVPLTDELDYLTFFRGLWWLGNAFTVCEHDVIPTDDQLAQLEECPEPWCAFNEYDGGPPSLSLARFRPAFISAHPNVWDDLRDAHRVSVFQPLWTRLDSWLTEQCGQPCLHTEPHVVNARPLGALH